MGKYSVLTKYIDLLENNQIGKWIAGNEHGDTSEKPIQMPFVAYSEVVHKLESDIYSFLHNCNKMVPSDYGTILNANEIVWEADSMKEANVDILDSECVLALLIAALRAERFCDGVLLDFIKSGAVLRWLKRLQELDEQKNN